MPPRAPACQIGALVKWWAMEMQQLRYFLAVLEHGSFSRAADDLGRSQQAISRAIQTLEEQVGVRLLDRGAGRVRPTAFGQMLVVHARGIIGHDKAFRDELRAGLGSQRGSVRLGAGPAVAELAFAAVEAAYRDIGPCTDHLAARIHADRRADVAFGNAEIQRLQSQ